MDRQQEEGFPFFKSRFGSIVQRGKPLRNHRGGSFKIMILNVDDSASGPERERRAKGEVPCVKPPALDTSNQFEVVPRDGGTIRLVIQGHKFYLTEAQAINLAAWLFAMADCNQRDFQRTLLEIAKK
jgi:hypothetical protein